MRHGLALWAALAAASWLGCRSAPGKPGNDHDIVPADMRARISFIASDMLRGRETPSVGLETAAGYVAAEFRRFGLEAPAGGYVQRYRLVSTEMGDGWSLSIGRGSRRAVLRHRQDFWGLPWAAGKVEGALRFVGEQPPAPVADGAETVWVARLTPRVPVRDWLRAAMSAGASGMLLVVPADLETHVSAWGAAGETILDLGDLEPSLPAVLVGEQGLTDALARVGVETAPLGESGARVQLAADLRVETLAAPNVLGILRGSDRRLKEEYVIISAHMDGLGVGPPVDGDSIYNGADDNASGTAAVLEVAEAMAALPRPPKRSVAFLTVSGEEKGLLGSSWFVDHPPIPLEKVIANLNVDMIGRNWEDTIAVVGKPYSTLGALVDSVAAAHPELNLKAVGDLWPREGFFFRSDHFNFARKGIPALFFFNGVHEDYHQPSDEVDKIKFEKAARVSRLIFEVALALANNAEPPRWDPRAREVIVENGR